MQTLVFDAEYFNIEDTLRCGQTFRFFPYKKGYIVISLDKVCYAYNENGKAYIETDFPNYFYNYFDLGVDYSKIVNSALSYNISVLTKAVTLGKGIRILRQDSVETLYHFIISQNNNIPRIQSSIEKLSTLYGQKILSPFGEFYAFPTIETLNNLTISDFLAVGLGYRAEYLKTLSSDIILNKINVENLKTLSATDLYNALISIKGVGDKVANCVTLFGFYKTKSFPVDTWIEKIYKTDFVGVLTNRKKITEYFISLFGDNAGYFQQYLFHYKRNLE